jgi:hypothetical protein
MVTLALFLVSAACRIKVYYCSTYPPTISVEVAGLEVTAAGPSALLTDALCSDCLMILVPLLHGRCLAGTLAVRLPILKWLNVPMPCESGTHTHTLQRPDCIIRLSLSPYTGKRSQQHGDDEGKLKQILERRKRRWKNGWDTLHSPVNLMSRSES